MPLLRLAWRNLWRHRRRTALLLLVVGYATLIIVFFWGVTDGFTESILSGHARFLSAPVVITTSSYREDPDPEHALPSLGFVEALDRAPGVQATAPRITFAALLSSPYATEGVEVRGIDPGSEPSVTRISQHVTGGRMLAAPGEVVLGKRLADRLDVRLGERVVLDASALAGPQAAGLVLAGIVESGMAAVDEGLVWVHIDDARQLTGVTTATEVALAVPWGQEEAIAASLQDMLPGGVRAYGILERLASLRQDLEGQRVEMSVIGSFLSLLASAAVVSTTLVSVLQRTREFGVMLAVGMRSRQLAALVTLETLLTTGLGWVAGLAFGYAATLACGRWNVLGPLFGGAYGDIFAGLGLSGEIYTASSPVYAVYATSTIAVALLLAVVAPIRRVMKLEPARALRTD